MSVNGSPARGLVAALVWAMLPLFATGCADRAVTWDGTMRDSAGVMIVENRGTPMWGEGDAWRFTKVLRIGVADGDSAYMFGSLTGLVILSDGRIVIGDTQYHNVRFFSPEGVHLSTVGREGAGPGEFRGIIKLLLGPGDTIIAVDERTRANVISPDGTWLSSYPTIPSGGFWIRSWDDDETTRQIVSLLRPLTVVPGAAPKDTRFDFLILRDFHGAFLDTLARLPTTELVTGEGNARLFHLYRGAPDYDLCDGLVVTGHSDEYRLTWQRYDGTVLRVATLDREPLALTDEGQTIWLQRLDAVDQQLQIPQERSAEMKSRIRFESTYPAYRRFVCGPAGTLLVQRIRPLRELTEAQVENLDLSDQPPGADEWDVFNREGRYLGVAPLPVPPHRQAFTRDSTGAWLMLEVERGEFDVLYAAVWRIEVGQ